MTETAKTIAAETFDHCVDEGRYHGFERLMTLDNSTGEKMTSSLAMEAFEEIRAIEAADEEEALARIRAMTTALCCAQTCIMLGK